MALWPCGLQTQRFMMELSARGAQVAVQLGWNQAIATFLITTGVVQKTQNKAQQLEKALLTPVTHPHPNSWHLANHLKYFLSATCSLHQLHLKELRQIHLKALTCGSVTFYFTFGRALHLMNLEYIYIFFFFFTFGVNSKQKNYPFLSITMVCLQILHLPSLLKVDCSKSNNNNQKKKKKRKTTTK